MFNSAMSRLGMALLLLPSIKSAWIDPFMAQDIMGHVPEMLSSENSDPSVILPGQIGQYRYNEQAARAMEKFLAKTGGSTKKAEDRQPRFLEEHPMMGSEFRDLPIQRHRMDKIDDGELTKNYTDLPVTVPFHHVKSKVHEMDVAFFGDDDFLLRQKRSDNAEAAENNAEEDSTDEPTSSNEIDVQASRRERLTRYRELENLHYNRQQKRSATDSDNTAADSDNIVAEGVEDGLPYVDNGMTQEGVREIVHNMVEE